MEKLKSCIHWLLKSVARHKLLLGTVSLVLFTIVCGPFIFTFVSTRGERYDLSETTIDNIPFHRVAIVFGAEILPNGQPTPYLKNRLDTAAKLYKAHRVNKLLMSGDNSKVDHNEPFIMQAYAVKLGVPEKDIAVDDAGFNTYDSCYRAHKLFGLGDATLISQGYHLPRAVTTCHGLGIQSVGVVATHPSRDFTINYILREFLSTDKMVLQLLFKPTPPILGKPLSV